MEHINVGSGEDVTILELAKIVAAVVGFDGRVVLDKSKPDGTPRKLMSGDKLAALGWKRNQPIKDWDPRNLSVVLVAGGRGLEARLGQVLVKRSD